MAKRKIAPMTMGNVGFHRRNLAAEAPPDQQYRELTKNAEEAIDRAVAAGVLAPGEGQILWDIDWAMVRDSVDQINRPYFKLCCIDNGVGMTGEEMVRYINGLSVSGGFQHEQGNYGIGAKVTALEQNPEGVFYQSWKGGQGSLVHLCIDEDSGDAGLAFLPINETDFREWQALGDGADLKPIWNANRDSVIGDHGTKVILWGRTDEDNTYFPPGEEQPAYYWLSKYLNRRWYKFSDNISHVRVRYMPKDVDNWPREPVNTSATVGDRGQCRLLNIKGQHWFLEKWSEKRGTVDLTNAIAHWWILKPSETEKGAKNPKGGPAIEGRRSGFYYSGHVAAIYQDELYESYYGRAAVAGKRMLQQFGVISGTDRVVIYVEPHHPTLKANNVRTGLLINQRPLPWDDWGVEFSKKMPEELKEFIAESLEDSYDSKNVDESIKKVERFFELPRYTVTKSKDLDAVGEAPGGVTRGPRGNPPRPPRPGPAGLFSKHFKTASGEAVEADSPKFHIPSAVWVSEDESGLHDRAARYVKPQNNIIINKDFRGFRVVVDDFMGLYGHINGAEGAIWLAVREWFERELKQAVMGVCELQGSSQWTLDQLDKALSEEALTASIMPKLTCVESVRRQLASTFGSLKSLEPPPDKEVA